MKFCRRFFGVILASLLLGSLVSVVKLVAQHAADAPDPDNADFDFSIFYTGNVRGNLEPCG